ncbi:hypothetical protein V2A60_003831 [Cordyceps javanica]
MTRKKPAGGGAVPVSATPKESLATTTASKGSNSGGGSGSVIVTESDGAPASSLSIPHQQRLLNHFAAAFDAVLTAASFPQLLQEIKQALFRRDFATAFGRTDYLAAYAARWSPTRALCYAGIFETYLPPHLTRTPAPSLSPSALSSSSCPPRRRTKMICVGGCAAEHVAFASFLAQRESSSRDGGGRGELTLLDSAPWDGVAATMQGALTAPLPLSKYASAAAKAANVPLLEATLGEPPQLHLQVLQQDALEITGARWADILGPADTSSTAVVVTLMFTLNELYTSGGIAKTTEFLKGLEGALPDGSLLLVVDSPGSYSEAALGKDKKRYPMQWLLHHTLTDPASAAQPWTRLESHDSIWFRLSDQLTYPIQLENMRYQLHLYRLEKTPAT